MNSFDVILKKKKILKKNKEEKQKQKLTNINLNASQKWTKPLKVNFA